MHVRDREQSRKSDIDMEQSSAVFMQFSLYMVKNCVIKYNKVIKVVGYNSG